MTSGSKSALSTGDIEIQLSFIDNDGQLCRQYAITNAENVAHGVACLQPGNGHWHQQIEINYDWAKQASELYQLASVASSPEIIVYVTEHINGIPLSLAEERQQLSEQAAAYQK